MSKYGSYILGDVVINLSTDIPPSSYYATEDYVNHFMLACKKLSQKLDYLVIVDTLMTEVLIINKIYDIAKEYANLVHIISPIVAFLQATITSLEENKMTLIKNKILVIFATKNLILSFILQRKNNFFYSQNVASEDYGTQSKYDFVICYYVGKNPSKEKLLSQFIRVSYTKVKNTRTTLTLGGFQKAICLAEFGKHLEVINFSPGISTPNFCIIKPCSNFPIRSYLPFTNDEYLALNSSFTFSTRITRKGNCLEKWNCPELYLSRAGIPVARNSSFIIEYNEFGLLNIYEYRIPVFNICVDQIQSIDVICVKTQRMAKINFKKCLFEVTEFDSQITNFDDENHEKNLEKLIINLSENYLNSSNSFVAILEDETMKKFAYIPNILFISPMNAILIFCLNYFKPTTNNIIIIITTKVESKFYALSRNEAPNYAVNYFSILSPSESVIDENILHGDETAKIYYLMEKNSQKFLFFVPSINSRVLRLEVSDFQEIIFQGGAMFGLNQFPESSQNGLIGIDSNVKQIIKENHTVKIEKSNHNQVQAHQHICCSLIIECDGDNFKIIDSDIDDEWIPIYVSFLHITPRIGNEALKDFKKSPEFVIYDIIKFLGKKLSYCPLINPTTAPLKVVAMDDSEDPKLGFKVQTQKGERICSPEMALAIYFTQLISEFERLINQKVTEIKCRFIGISLEEYQEKALKEVGAKINKVIISDFCIE